MTETPDMKSVDSSVAQSGGTASPKSDSPCKSEGWDPEEFDHWYQVVRGWSGSAFVAGEKMPVRRQREHLVQLYGDLCSLGNHLMCWADQARVSPPPTSEASLLVEGGSSGGNPDMTPSGASDGQRSAGQAKHADDCQIHIVDVRGRPDDCTCGAEDEEEAQSDLEQQFTEALQDSLGPDWTCRDGARAVLALLQSDPPSRAEGAFVLTVTATADGHEVAINHPMGSDAWINARDAMIAAHAELARHLAKQDECPARPAILSVEESEG
jgi:hypothetical protein